MRKRTVFISFFTSCTQPCPSDLSVHTHPVCWRVCVRTLAHAAFTRGVGVNAWWRACLKRGADATFQAPRRRQPIRSPHAIPNPFMQHQRSMWLVVVTMTARQHHASDTPSVKRWRRRPVWMQREPERAHTHVTHRMCVRTQITWTWLCTRGKKRYKYCSFSHTNRSFRVLGHQVCSYDGELFNLDFSVHVLFPSYRDSDLYLPLYDWQTRTVWPKNIKNWIYWRKKTPTSWMPLG